MRQECNGKVFSVPISSILHGAHWWVAGSFWPFAVLAWFAG